MANVLKHKFQSAKSDNADTTKVQPSNWNAEHAFAGGALGSLLYRDTGQSDGASWLANVAKGSLLASQGVGTAPAYQSKPWLDVRDYGTTADGATDDSTAIQAALSALAEGGTLLFPPGHYIAHSLSLSGINSIHLVGVGDVLIEQPAAGSDTTQYRRVLDLDSCDDFRIQNIRFKGQQRHASAGHNRTQWGVRIYQCDGGAIEGCAAEAFNVGFRIDTCSDVSVRRCEFSSGYTGYEISASTNCRVDDCISVNAHYQPLGGSIGELSAGYGFLSDESTGTVFSRCTSYRGGSDCFRLQHTTAAINGVVEHCRSISSNRNALSIRGAYGRNVRIDDFEILDLRDPSYWTGESGTYTELYPDQGTGVYFAASSGIGDCQLRALRLVNALATEANAVGVRVDVSGVEISDAYIVGALKTGGIRAYAGTDALMVRDSSVHLHDAVDVGDNVPIELASATNSQVVNSVTVGGYDGIRLGETCIARDCTVKLPNRHGVRAAGDQPRIERVRVVNPTGAADSYSAGFYVAGTNAQVLECVIDNTLATTYRSAWFAATATGGTLRGLEVVGTALATRFDATPAFTLYAPGATPASASAAGTAGQVYWDANYVYICTATDTWKRVAIGTWP